MDGRARGATIAAVVALAAGLALLATDPYVSPVLQVGLAAASGVAFCALAAFAGVRYARERAPETLFLAVGAGAVGAQALLFGVVWVARARGIGAAVEPAVTGTLMLAEPWPVGDGPVTAWLAGWAVGALCFVLAVPWWERRGRPPVRPGVVVVAAAAGLAAVDLAIAVTFDDGPAGTSPAGTSPGPVAVGFGVLAIAGLATAGIRELRFRGSAAPHPQLGLAWTLAALVPIAQIQRLTFGLELVRWVDAVAVIAPAVVVAGLLAAERSDANRLRRASDRADEVLGGRAEIASMVAHEVRGPVATIKGLAATTAGSYDRLSDDERREFVGLIEQEAARLLEVVDQTSLALKIDAGTLSFDRRPHDLAGVVREALAAARVDEHPVSDRLAEGIVATVDRRWLAEAVRQVVDNAARFSPPGSPIEVRLEAEAGTAVIEVRDRGPGIPPERRAEVFGRFVRWRPPGYEDRQGTGLGLFICRGICAEHGGSASLDAGREGGTMLRLLIPVGPPPTEDRAGA